MTVIVGPNGAGKSTVLEALRSAASRQPNSFSVGARNLAAGDEVEIQWQVDGQESRLRSIRPSASETTRVGEPLSRLVYLPSRRSFNPYFFESYADRNQYSGGFQLPAFRGQPFEQFVGRLFKIEREGPREAFDQVVQEIAGSSLDWSIDRHDAGQFFVSVRTSAGRSHSSDGLGEGTLSLLFIADALYDSDPGDIIVIDEPELSLHPFHQRRLARTLARYSLDRQVILATHSPYFVSWSDLIAGGSIHRVHLDNVGGSRIATPTRDTLKALARLATDLQNPHVLGLNASEVFFLDDCVILTEGQEDVLVYRAIAEELDIAVRGEFFGWGVGGAEKMARVVDLLRELGFRKIFGILDGDRRELSAELAERYANFCFVAIPAADVRDKPGIAIRPAVVGLADRRGRLHEVMKQPAIDLLTSINDYMGSPVSEDADSSFAQDARELHEPSASGIRKEVDAPTPSPEITS